MLARDFPAAQSAIEAFPSRLCLPFLGRRCPRAYLAGCIWLAQGGNARAQEFFEAARPSMEAETLAHPNDVRHARLGLLYAYMGRKTDAIREGKRAVDSASIRGRHRWSQWLCNLALIHARVGDRDQAIPMIESSSPAAGLCFATQRSMPHALGSASALAMGPVTEDPRFQKILVNPEPATIY